MTPTLQALLLSSLLLSVWPLSASASLTVYTNRSTWQALQPCLATDDLESDPTGNHTTPYQTAGGFSFAAVSGANETISVFGGGSVNGSKEVHFREFGPGMILAADHASVAIGFDYATSNESWDVLVGGNVVATLPGNTHGFFGLKSHDGAVYAVVLRSLSGVQGGISLDNLSTNSQSGEMLVSGQSLALHGASYLQPACGAVIEYRWRLGTTVVRDWSSADYVVSPAATTSYLLDARCSSAPGNVQSAIVTTQVVSALGAATLVRNGDGTLTASNLGSSGSDGVSFDLNGVVRWDGEWDTPDTLLSGLTNGAYLELSPRGTRNGVANQLIGSTRVTIVGDSAAISADFSAVGSSTMTVVVFDGGPNGVLVAAVPGRSGTVATMTSFSHDIHVEFPPEGGIKIDHTKKSKGSFAIRGFGVVQGDYLCLVPENPTSVIGPATSARILAKNIPALHFTDSDIVSSVAPPAPPPPPAPMSSPAVNTLIVVLLGAAGVASVFRRPGIHARGE